MLRGVVRLVTEATRCHACFVYFLDGDALTLRAASRMYEHLEGGVVIPVGEGLTGWVARTRRSAFIKEGALEDPRVRRASFPELGDEVYESLVSVPIFARSGDVIGVITLHAEAPHEFARSDLEFLENTAALIAGAVENAHLYEDATARVALLSDLSRLSQRIASAASQAQVLDAVTEGVLGLLGAQRCEIHLAGSDGRLRLAATRPDAAARTRSDHGGRWLDALADDPLSGRDEPASRLASVLWGDDLPGIPLFAPLVAGGERLGLIGVIVSGRVDAAATALSGLAAHAAVALKQHQVIEHLREQNLLKDFFRTLAQPDPPEDALRELGGRLGCDLDAPHLLLHVIPWAADPPGRVTSPGRDHPRAAWPTLAAQAETRLIDAFPGMLIDRLERSLRGLLPMGGDPADAIVGSLRRMEWGGERGGGLSVGISNPCLGVHAFAQGFREAQSASEVGALLRGAPGTTAFEDLGPYRYVLDAGEGDRDRTQQRLELLVAYDGRKGTQLLDTLEAFLDHRGGLVATSRALYIHTNTLRQRLDRVERVSGVDLGRDDWLSLAVATKVVKLRRMRESAREGRGNDG
jgi:putative methionine-R-sulfoxide reductase with GAF domain